MPGQYLAPPTAFSNSLNHTYNIKVKTHETAIFVTAYLVAKGLYLLSKMLTKWKQLGSI